MAIARGNYTNALSSGTGDRTVAFDSGTLGSDRYLIVFVNYQGAGSPSSVTYNSVAMTLLRASGDAASYRLHVYGLANPATGSNNIFVDVTGTPETDVGAAVYTGVSQTGQPDATGAATAGSGSTFASTITTVADNCWLVGNVRNTVSAPGAGADTTVLASGGGQGIADSGGAKTPAGATALNYTASGSTAWNSAIVSLLPASDNLANLKTFNGVAKASIKAINGTALASIKSWDGIV